MTTTIVYGLTADGYLSSINSTYATSRNGSGVTANTGGNALFYGQNNNGGSYTNLQAFLGFSWVLPAGERVTSAMVRMKHASILGSGVARDLELRAYDWAAAVDAADWRNPTNLAALPVYGRVDSTNTAGTRYCYAGSDELLAALASSTTVKLVAVSSRQRAGTVPTTDEGASIWSAETADAPALVVTSAPAFSQLRVLGAQVQLSDGAWAMLTASDADPTATITLTHVSQSGVATAVATVLTGTGAGTFGLPVGAQAFDLVVDPSDNLYVVGRRGDAENTLAVRRYTKGAGLTWTQETMRSGAMSAHDTSINAVAAAWHDAGAGGTIVVVLRHTAGQSSPYVPSPPGGDASYALLNGQFIGGGPGQLLRHSGAGLLAVQAAPNSADLSMPANDTGAGLDVTAVSATQGLAVSFDRGARLGENGPLTYTWYTLSADGETITSTSSGSAPAGVKDAGARARTLRISDTEAVVATAADTTGAGITLLSQQRFGSGAPLDLGVATLDAETATMPDPAALARTALWDAVYAPVDGRVWVYYFDRADARRLLRTAFSVQTHLPTGETIQVVAAAVPAGSTVKAIRVQRGRAGGRWGLVTVFSATGAGAPQTTYLVDSFNLPPTQPLLATRAGFDATAPAAVAWTFTDPNPGDTQSAYRVEIVTAGAGTLVYDTGKVVSAAASHTVPAGTLANGTSYQWRVSTWDYLDAAGAPSDWGAFTTAAGGTVTITEPAVDNQAGVIEDAYQVRWTVAGTVQASYRVRLIRQSDGAQISDTGFVTSTATTATVTGMLSGVTYRVEVTVRNDAAVASSTATRLITPDYGSPEAPQLSAVGVDDAGHILLQVTNPVPGSVNLGTTPAGFDTADVTGWVATGGTFAQSTAQAHSGTGSGLLTTTGTPAATSVQQVPANAVPVVAGRRYTARWWVYSPTGRATALNITWRDAGQAVLSTSQLAPVAVGAGVWTELVFTATAPVGAAYAQHGPVTRDNPATGLQLHVDDGILVDANDLPEVIRNDLYRRPAGTAAWRKIGEVPRGGTFRDYDTAAGVAYEYLARGVS